MHEDHPVRRGHLERAALRVCVVIAVEHDLGTQITHRLDLDLRGRPRHHDEGAQGEPPRRERDALRVVAGARGDYAVRALVWCQSRDSIVRAAKLEAEDRLLVFALQEDVVSDALREPRRRIERRLARDLVDAARENRAEDLVDGSRCRRHGQCRRRSILPKP